MEDSAVPRSVARGSAGGSNESFLASSYGALVRARNRVGSKNERRRHSTLVRVTRPATSIPSGWVEVDPSTTGYSSRVSRSSASPGAATPSRRAARAPAPILLTNPDERDSRTSHLRQAQVLAQLLGRAQDGGDRPLVDDAAGGQHVDVVRHGESEAHVLLDEQDRVPVRAQAAQDLPELRHD